MKEQITTATPQYHDQPTTLHAVNSPDDLVTAITQLIHRLRTLGPLTHIKKID